MRSSEKIKGVGINIILNILFLSLLAVCGAAIAGCGVRDGFWEGRCFETLFGEFFLFIGILGLAGLFVTGRNNSIRGDIVR